MLKTKIASRRDPDPENIPDKVKQYYPKNGIGDWIGVKSDDPNPICYLSGTLGAKTWSEKDFQEKTGARFRCFSYAYCGFGSPLMQSRHVTSLEYCLTHGVRVFLDSGAHSFHKMRLYDSHFKGITRQEKVDAANELSERFLVSYAKYVRWCYSQGKRFDFAVTFDHDKNCETIFNVTKKLLKLSVFSVPVYHGDQSTDWIKKYADLGHKIIGVGVARQGKHSRDGLRRYYETVLSFCNRLGIVCHGFAVTGDLMLEYPWYSTDSTTWLKAGAYGKILDIRPEKQRVALIHVSSRFSSQTAYGRIDKLSPETFKYIRDQVESRGFDFEQIQNDMSVRAMYNAKVTLEAVEKNKPKPWKAWGNVF